MFNNFNIIENTDFDSFDLLLNTIIYSYVHSYRNCGRQKDEI